MPLKKKRKVAELEEAEASEAVAAVPAPPRVKRRRAAAAEPAATAPEEANAAAAEPPKVKKTRRGKSLKQARKRAEAQLAAEESGSKDGGAANATSAEASGDVSEKGATATAADDCTVFVSGVPYIWQLDKLRDIFAKCGEVVDVRAPTWQDSGRLRGYAHITFAKRKARDEAIQMDGVKVGAKGRYLKIEAAKPPGGTPAAVDPKDVVGKKRLFVKNLPYDATETELQELFGAFGTVVDVRVPTSFGRSKGFAYVEYAKAHSLAKVVEAGAEIRGRRLFLDADAGQGPKAGFHYRGTAYEQENVKAGGGRGGGSGRGFASGRGQGGGRGSGRGPKL